jgi:hypothetical protein
MVQSGRRCRYYLDSPNEDDSHGAQNFIIYHGQTSGGMDSTHDIRPGYNPHYPWKRTGWGIELTLSISE